MKILIRTQIRFLCRLLLCLLFAPISNSFSIDKNILVNVKSGVLLVGVCKETVDYSLMPVDQQKFLKNKYGDKYDIYVAELAKEKPFCSIYKSKRKNMSFVRSNSGSSFLINKAGYIVTNYHVVTQYNNIVVYDGGPDGIKMRSANVVWRSRKNDLVILKVNKLRATRVPLSLANASVINQLINEDVWSLGFTGVSTDSIAKVLSLEVKTDKGVIRSKPEKRYLGTNTPVTTIEHSAFIHFGNSGGPLVDHCGRVLGINQGGPKKVTGIGWAIHVGHLLQALNANNISYDLSVETCGYYSEGGAGSGSLLAYIVAGTLLIIIFSGIWFYRQRQARPVGLTQFVRREMSRYFKRDEKSCDKLLDHNEAQGVAKKIVIDDFFAILVGVHSMSDRKFEMRGEGEAILGRADEADVHVASDSVGRLHVRLKWQASSNSIWIEDLNSTNGTFLQEGQKLSPGEKVTLESGSSFYLAEPEYAFKVSTKN